MRAADCVCALIVCVCVCVESPGDPSPRGNINFCFDRWKLSGKSDPPLRAVMDLRPLTPVVVVDVKKFRGTNTYTVFDCPSSLRGMGLLAHLTNEETKAH